METDRTKSHAENIKKKWQLLSVEPTDAQYCVCTHCSPVSLSLTGFESAAVFVTYYEYTQS